MSWRDKVLSMVIDVEGGYTNNPDDHGGPTNYGITLSTLQFARGDANLDATDVRRLTYEEAVDIYKRLYATPFLWIEDASVYKFVLNAAVQHGVPAATRLLQRALQVKDDGRIGPATKAAYTSTPAAVLLQRLVIERLRYYADIIRAKPSQRTFAAGWMARIANDLSPLEDF